jgi:RNA polymerase sigma-54 factor
MKGPNFEMRMGQGQHLTLTPRLQQSLRLLRYSALELEAVISQALAENPMLELADGPAPEYGGTGETAAHAESAPDESVPGEADELRFEADGYDTPGRNQGSSDDAGPAESAGQQSLRDFLLEQLALTRATPRDKVLTELLIEAIDDNGYLESSLADVLSWLPEGHDVEPEELNVALRLLQSFDPAGVGARDLAECLVLQLRRMPPATPREARVHDCVVELCAHHLPLLANGNFVKLREILQCGDEMLNAAHALTLQLDPHPGHAWTVQVADNAVPDVIVRKARKGGWQVVLNPSVVPRLHVNEMYARLLEGRRETGSAGLQEQLQQARWLLRNVQQRFDTILRVAQAVVERQSDYFTNGPTAMRPLILADIAQALGMHESTVSRATMGKYMLTPFGTVELKHFFSIGLSTQEGDTISAKAVQARIRRMVDEEAANQPLSDDQISRRLAEQGIVVARRTVAKYRDVMRIAPMMVRRAQAQAQAR